MYLKNVKDQSSSVMVEMFIRNNPAKVEKVPFIDTSWYVPGLTGTRSGTSRRGGEIARKYMVESERPSLMDFAK